MTRETPDRLVSHSVASIEGLRLFVRDHYGGTPPRLVWIAGIPLREGGGIRYEYADATGGALDTRWTWFSDDGAAPERPPLVELDPLRAALGDSQPANGAGR